MKKEIKSLADKRRKFISRIANYTENAKVLKKFEKDLDELINLRKETNQNLKEELKEGLKDLFEEGKTSNKFVNKAFENIMEK